MTSKEFKTQLLPIQNKLFGLAVAMLGNRIEAEDIIQDVFVKCWEMRDELSQYKSIEAMTMTMTKNRCIDQLRSYRNKNRSSLQEVVIPAGVSDPVQALELKESLRQVHEIIQQLPDKQRLVLHLRNVEQYSYDEIEEITGLTRNNIRVSLSRARKKVLENYQKRQDYDNRRDQKTN